MRKLIYILLFFLNVGYAQEILTTDQAVKLTLENNLDILAVSYTHLTLPTSDLV